MATCAKPGALPLGLPRAQRPPSQTGSCPRTHHCHPVIQRALARSHTYFSRLLGNRLVREQPQPDLAAALDKSRHGDTAGLDLAVSNVTAPPSPSARTRRTTARRAAPRLAAPLALLLLPKLHLLWHQHNENPQKAAVSSQLSALSFCLYLSHVLRAHSTCR